jgi:hypothetical protein
MEPIITRTPTAIGDIEIQLFAPADSGESKQALFSIQVLDQTGRVVQDWFRRGDLVPFLDDSSTYLTTADRALFSDLLDRIRQEAALRILG